MNEQLSVLSWNVHGIGGREKRRLVNELLWKTKANLICLQEHRLDNFGVGLLKLAHSGMEVFSSVKRKGAGGTLVLAPSEWCAKLAFSHPEGQVLGLEVRRMGLVWLLISVYAPNEKEERKCLWEWIGDRVLGREVLLVGDLNRGDEEHTDEWNRLSGLLKLEDVVNLAGENGDQGPTWSRISQAGIVTRSRLDKCYASNKGLWLSPPFQYVVDRKPVCSDHFPISFKWNVRADSSIRRSPFKLNVKHLKNKAFGAMVRNEWDLVCKDLLSPLEQFDVVIARIAINAAAFGRAYKKKQLEDYDVCLRELVHLRLAFNNSWSEQQGLRMRELELKLQQLDRARVSAAKLHSGVRWLQDGDAPSKFFFDKVRDKRRQETIVGIRDTGGEWVTDQAKIGQIFVDSLQSICGKDETLITNQLESRRTLLGCVRHHLDAEDMKRCESVFSEGELLEALRAMPMGKAPGVDGIPKEFYETYWPVVGPTVTAMANAAKREGKLSPTVNTGLIKLIPKNPSREKTSDWRPITLLNTSYKILAKALALRIKYLVPKLVRKDQSGFVHGRSIFDNILNVVGAMDYVRAEGIHAIMLGIDMDKAYDRVEWSYILAVLEQVGFGPSFRSMISMLFSNASANVLVNGAPRGSFNLRRSIRQGCPIAPLLYAIITEPLMAMYVRETTLGRLKGLSIPGTDEHLGIQLFADDSNAFCMASEEGVDRTLEIFNMHCLASGSMINIKKTHAVWIGSGQRPEWSEKYGFQWLPKGQVLRHLGFPIGMDITTFDRANWTLNKAEKKFQYWRKRMLSFGGRLTVAKHILSPTIMYPLSLSLFSKASHLRFDKMLRKFIWSEETGVRRFHTASWRLLTSPKEEGGAGLPEMRLMAVALIAKLLPKVLAGRSPWTYFFWQFIEKAHIEVLPGSTQLDREEKLLSAVRIKIRNSPLFNGLLQAWKMAGAYIHWKGRPRGRADSALSQSIWWQRGMCGGEEMGVCHREAACKLSKRGILRWEHLWDKFQLRWCSSEVLRQMYGLTTDEVALLRKVLHDIPDWFPTNMYCGQRDYLVEWEWISGHPLGRTQVKVVYRALSYKVRWIDNFNSRWRRSDSVECWSSRCFKVWKGSPYYRLNVWNWKVLSGSLKTGDKLRSWEGISGLCAWCKRAKEDSLHLFWACPMTRCFWMEVSRKLKCIFGHAKLSAHMVLLGKVYGHSSDLSFAWPLCRAVFTEELWKERNNVRFNGGKCDLSIRLARSCLLKVAWLLKVWPGRGQEVAAQIAARFYGELLEAG